MFEIATTRYDPTEAELTVTYAPDDPAAVAPGAELRGKFEGPSSAYAETVEVAYALRPLPREEDVLRARVIIPEPCFWSPAAPLLYRGTVELWQGGAARERATPSW